MKRHPQTTIDAAVAAYGVRSMTLVAADLGVSPGAVSYWWAEARRTGKIAPLFGRFDGGRTTTGRVSRGRGLATYEDPRMEVERAASRRPPQGVGETR